MSELLIAPGFGPTTALRSDVIPQSVVARPGLAGVPWGVELVVHVVVLYGVAAGVVRARLEHHRHLEAVPVSWGRVTSMWMRSFFPSPSESVDEVTHSSCST